MTFTLARQTVHPATVQRSDAERKGITPSHLPGLGAIRFLAAVSVVVHHIEQTKSMEGLANHWDNPVIAAIGHQGVLLFFVLSGYLITYLLLLERDQKKTIDVRAFYVRRILRIWPLYYSVMLCGFLLVPWLFHGDFVPEIVRASNAILEKSFPQILALCLLMFPNIAITKYGAIFLIAPTWSLGIEEQFYLVWPWFVRLTRGILPAALVAVLGIKRWILPALWGRLHSWLPPGLSTQTVLAVLGYVSELPTDFMVYGALGATLLHRGSRFVHKYLQNRICGTLCIGLLVAGLAGKLEVWAGPAYALVLLSVTSGRLGIIPMESRALNNLGDRSYSLYLLHSPSITAAIALLGWLRITGAAFAGLVYVLSFAFAFASSALSYRFIETPFLRIKRHWAKIAV